MKKIIVSTLVMIMSVILTACETRPTLRILNWGEYINEDVITQFEALTGYAVIVDVTDSNESFYAKIKAGTTAYDIVIPSDYMVEKFVDEDLIYILDQDKLTNLSQVTYLNDVNDIFDSMTETTLDRTDKNIDYHDYAIPYFWGSFGLMYNNRIDGLEEAIHSDGWNILFNETETFSDLRRGMYDVAQYAYAAASFYQGQDINKLSTKSLDAAEAAIRQANFTQWADDLLKRQIESNNLDIAFTYTGDYLDRLYLQLAEGRTIEEVQAEFNIYIPDQTLGFMDLLVIPKTSKQVDMAHEFINYMLDPSIVAQNAEVVGYAVAFVEAYDIIMSYLDSNDQTYKNWAQAYQLYYDMYSEQTYIPLTVLSTQDIDLINTMIDNLKS